MEKPDISAVLEYYEADMSRVRPSGNSKLKCPFHEDKVASASVNLETGKFRCFACPARGDSIDLIVFKEGGDIRDALEWARSHTGFTGTGVRKAAPGRYRPSWAEDDD